MHAKYSYIYGIALYVVLFVTLIVFWPGLYGTFIFDDAPNLQGLTSLVANPSLNQFFQFLSESPASNLGRPVAMSSFAMQFYDWPDYPAAFKYFNLLIHLLNGTLVFWLTYKVLDLKQHLHPGLLATLALFIWIMHPLQISTVLYVVQRMTQLSALFVLAGMVAYVYGRGIVTTNGHRFQGYTLMSLAILVFMPLSILSKENGIMMPLLIIIMEITLFAELVKPQHWRIWFFPFLLLPLMLFAMYLGVNAEGLFVNGYAHRPFTLYERLLTEFRILIDYIFKFLAPNPSRFGLFFDDYTVSKGLFSPVTTLLSIAVIMLSVWGALTWRSRHPFLAFAILWFLAAQVLESSIIPLELYFEHRNYLPLVGPSIALAYYAYTAICKIDNTRLRALSVVGLSVVFTLLGLITLQETTLWGQPFTQAKIWAEERPHSKRALDWYATMLINNARVRDAADVYLRIHETDPLDTAPPIILTELACYDDSIIPPSPTDYANTLRSGKRYFYAATRSIDNIIVLKEKHDCPSVNIDTVLLMLDLLMQNKHYDKYQDSLLFLKARALALKGEIDAAIGAYEKAFTLSPSLPHLLILAEFSARNGKFDTARKYINMVYKDDSFDNREKVIYSQQLDALQKLLSMDTTTNH